MKDLRGHGDTVYALAFNGDNTTLASGNIWFNLCFLILCWSHGWINLELLQSSSSSIKFQGVTRILLMWSQVVLLFFRRAGWNVEGLGHQERRYHGKPQVTFRPRGCKLIRFRADKRPCSKFIQIECLMQTKRSNPFKAGTLFGHKCFPFSAKFTVLPSYWAPTQPSRRRCTALCTIRAMCFLPRVRKLLFHSTNVGKYTQNKLEQVVCNPPSGSSSPK